MTHDLHYKYDEIHSTDSLSYVMKTKLHSDSIETKDLIYSKATATLHLDTLRKPSNSGETTGRCTTSECVGTCCHSVGCLAVAPRKHEPPQQQQLSSDRKQPESSSSSSSPAERHRNIKQTPAAKHNLWTSAGVLFWAGGMRLTQTHEKEG